MNWIPISDDDFKAIEGDYMLRAEQMDGDVWWWEVYYRHESIIGHCYYQPETEELAKAMAEMVYLAHKNALRLTPNKFNHP